MNDTRKPIVMRCKTHGYANSYGHLNLECLSSAAYAGIGYYVLVPVNDLPAADELVKRLQDQLSGES